MAELPSEAPKRVLLTSENRPNLHPLATVVHDAGNKLTPIIIGLDEREGKLEMNHFSALKLLVRDIRKRLQELQKALSPEEPDSEQLMQDLMHMHGRLGIIFNHIDEANGDYKVSREVYRESVKEFDMLIDRGISLLQSKSHEEKTVQGDISAYLADIISDYQRHYPHIQFETYIEPDREAKFQPHRLKRALENLLNNAIQALPEEGGVITTMLTGRFIGQEGRPFAEIQEGCYVSIEIVDNGPGIPEDILSRLSHSSITTKESGSGCGLVSARKSLIKHKGHLYIESEEGNGTRVTALIPSSYPPPRMEPEHPEGAQPA